LVSVGTFWALSDRLGSKTALLEEPLLPVPCTPEQQDLNTAQHSSSQFLGPSYTENPEKRQHQKLSKIIHSTSDFIALYIIYCSLQKIVSFLRALASKQKSNFHIIQVEM